MTMAEGIKKLSGCSLSRPVLVQRYHDVSIRIVLTTRPQPTFLPLTPNKIC